ncbi:MAG: DUF3276 family protein [Chitinophagales bacterium]|nr:DUF3276 family protein [Chitinophagales bacterium]
MEEKKGSFKSESVFSKKLRAGKRRTYFFDVKSTKANDYFLTITESKKRQDDSYERFKIFLYKEDFNKFIESLNETIDYVKRELMPHYDFDEFARRQAEYEKNRDATRVEGDASNASPPVEDHNEGEQRGGGPDSISGTVETMPEDKSLNEEDLKW